MFYTAPHRDKLTGDMQIKTALIAGLAASSAAAQRSCGAPSPTPEQIEVSKLFAAQEEAARSAGNSTSAQRASINVNVYFHVLASSNSASGGYLSVSQDRGIAGAPRIGVKKVMLWVPACTDVAVASSPSHRPRRFLASSTP